MLSVDEALRLVLARAKPPAAVACELSDALGLTLAEDVAADLDSPPHDKSLVDGYAIVAADLNGPAVELEIVEEVAAGAVPTRVVASGTATRIMTGAPLPSGADAVVMVEQTEMAHAAGNLGRVRLLAGHAVAGQNIMRRSASMARGQIALSAGAEIRSIEIGVLAEVGRSEVAVIPRPTLAVLATGNELVAGAQLLGPGQIRNSNGPMLLAAARAAGALPVELGIGRDDRQSLQELVARGLASDLLVISGGVSAGKFDLVPEVLASLGVEQVFHKVNLKPGKPLWFGVRATPQRDTLVFGLPGNPVSSIVCFELFVRPAIDAFLARSNNTPREIMAQLAGEYTQRGDRPTYHPARLTVAPGGASVVPLRWQGSGDLRTLADANALACFPMGERVFGDGETIAVLPLSGR